MDILDVFALLVMILLVAVLIWLVVLLGSLPGKVARDRGHPQADAIQVLGWIGIITLGVSWFIAFTWAYTKPLAGRSDPELEARVRSLENQIAKLGGAEDAS